MTRERCLIYTSFARPRGAREGSYRAPLSSVDRNRTRTSPSRPSDTSTQRRYVYRTRRYGHETLTDHRRGRTGCTTGHP